MFVGNESGVVVESYGRVNTKNVQCSPVLLARRMKRSKCSPRYK